MRVVVDTNVLVSGFLSPFGPPGEIVRMIAAGALAVCFDARIIAEYRRVLARPRFSFRLEDIQTFLDQLRAAGVVAAGDPLPANLPDPGDAPFLEIALAGRAACLIAGNLKHYPAPLRQGMRVLGPGAFLDFYRGQRRKKRPRR